MRTNTVWFKARHVSPVREGMYEVKTTRPLRKGDPETYEQITIPDYAHPKFRYWDGEHWFLVRKDSFEKSDPAKAFGHGLYQFWRGLTRQAYELRCDAWGLEKEPEMPTHRILKP